MATEADRHTGEFVAEKIEEILEEIGPHRFQAIITDNAAAMIKGRNLIRDKHQHIAVYSCAAHILNLLVSDTAKMKTLSLIEADCKAIVKEINNSHVLLATFVAIQKEKKGNSISLKLPVKTRWGSLQFCLKSLLDTKYALKTLAVKEEVEDILSNRVKSMILDDAVFWLRVLKFHDLITPIVKWITLLESDTSRLSLVVESFKELEDHLAKVLPLSPFTKQEEKQLKEAVQKRRDMALQPIHFAANILDPKYNGVHLSRDEQIQGTEFIDQKISTNALNDAHAQDILAELAEYRAKEGFFSKTYVLKSIEKVDAIVWWKGICFGSKLSRVAVDILSMPPTTAATERSFSTYGLIHSAKRNRLTVDRAGNLTYVAHNLKLLKEKKVQHPQPSTSFCDNDHDHLTVTSGDEEDEDTDC